MTALMARVEQAALLRSAAGPALRLAHFRYKALHMQTGMVWVMRRYRVA